MIAQSEFSIGEKRRRISEEIGIKLTLDSHAKDFNKIRGSGNESSKSNTIILTGYWLLAALACPFSTI